MRAVLAFILFFAAASGCERDSKNVDLSSPPAAARCQAEAIRAGDPSRWKLCFHPKVRSEVDLDKAMAQLFALDQAVLESAAKRLEAASSSDFTITPIQGNGNDLGDQRARLPLDGDAFEVVRLEGEWFIVDSGL